MRAPWRRAGRRRGPLFTPLRERNPVLVGAAGLLALALAATLAWNADALPFIGGGTTYHADFTEAAGLTPGNEVRVAGVKVGKVTGVALDGARVEVTFEVKDTWIGDASTAAIGIKTLLGEKYLALDPLGAAPQNPATRIPVTRTTSPYDVTQALGGLGRTLGALDTRQLARSFQAVSDAFRNTPASVRGAVTGLTALSRTVASRDAQLARLLDASKDVTRTLAGDDDHVEKLIGDGSALLGELQRRRDAVHALLTGTRDLGTQLTGLVRENERQLAPTLDALDRVTSVLQANYANLQQVLALAGPYYRLIGNTLGNGRWFDTYLCGLVPKDYLPPGTPPATGCMPPKPAGGGR
ncbi:MULTISPECIES: MCE family protein [Streptomycetaceae]|uniref:Putative Mce family protein n=1 Tax=Streptantibioticus cattleyicolor (strain ATCC 35852 / DSM 46488 / JCM 4925 / NBRC 14057 / NRRL 8057) TaxID=1003195 RepID=F8JUH1_STREN|nr:MULTISPECIES: MCE family protein [Streptomycetaceae]AEW95593.1 putative Mce family protein [Streptantibioticus cattleyicolor NRRL 8057 = DSM 46488]MYS60143.1 MCE family protein [Streptomyces sp. SID5468]CCB75930.1 putative Mce family protein [Streptantibioticus cattleyicolor NRRL 8057 = DSM 46488]